MTVFGTLMLKKTVNTITVRVTSTLVMVLDYMAVQIYHRFDFRVKTAMALLSVQCHQNTKPYFRCGKAPRTLGRAIFARIQER
jgi:hypothetical protein